MGCNSSCLINCPEIISDQCVQYTGPDVPALGICQGDQLSTVERVVLTQLQNALVGTGITPDQVTLADCPWLVEQFGQDDPNLSNLLQLLINSSCTLKEMIDTINEELVAQSANFNTLCLQGLSTNPTPNEILQAVINTLCTLNTAVASFPTTYVKNSDLNNLIQQQITIYLANSQTGNIEYFQYLPLLTALPYFGSLSNFDNTGKGLAANGMTNLYLCNGQNGTPDLRGRTLVGAVRNVPGGTLDAAVDPINPNNPNWAQGDVGGENKHLLTINETPAHSHGVTDPGHKHPYHYPNNDTSTGSNNPSARADNFTSIFTDTAITNISIQNTGGGLPHNNIQPSYATNWIIRML